MKFFRVWYRENMDRHLGYTTVPALDEEEAKRSCTYRLRDVGIEIAIHHVQEV